MLPQKSVHKKIVLARAGKKLRAAACAALTALIVCALSLSFFAPPALREGGQSAFSQAGDGQGGDVSIVSRPPPAQAHRYALLALLPALVGAAALTGAASPRPLRYASAFVRLIARTTRERQGHG